VTDTDIVDAMRSLPAEVLSRVAAWVAHQRPDLPQTGIASHLRIDDPDSGTFRRTLEGLRKGVPVMDTFQQFVRCGGNTDDRTVTTVIEFLKENSTPANSGRFLKRFPEEQHRHLSDTLSHLHRRFLVANPDISLSYGKFWGIRHNYAPYIVKPPDTAHAGCEYCNNVRFRLDSLRRHPGSLTCSCARLGQQDRVSARARKLQ